MTGWYDAAACRGRPTAWWYPDPGDVFAAQVAKLVCRGCPVRAECLDAAELEELGTRPFGIRGGLTARARADRRRRPRAARGTSGAQTVGQRGERREPLSS